MELRIKINAVIVGLALGLSGCQNYPAIDEAFGGHPNARSSGVALATQPETSQTKPIQLIPPNDKQVVAAMKEAMPNIAKVLGIHSCVEDNASLRMMNVYAVPGENMARGNGWQDFPNNNEVMKYHDRSKCVSLSTLDQWSMPALNALKFRVVYFAYDSGETVSFQYIFKKMDDGSWKIADYDKL